MKKESKAFIAEGVKDMEVRQLEEKLKMVTDEKRVMMDALENLRNTLNEMVTARRHEKSELERKLREAEKKLRLEEKYSGVCHAELVRTLRAMDKIRKTGMVMTLVVLGLLCLSVSCVFQSGLSWLVPICLGLGDLGILLITMMIGGAGYVV